MALCHSVSVPDLQVPLDCRSSKGSPNSSATKQSCQLAGLPHLRPNFTKGKRWPGAQWHSVLMIAHRTELTQTETPVHNLFQTPRRLFPCLFVLPFPTWLSQVLFHRIFYTTSQHLFTACSDIYPPPHRRTHLSIANHARRFQVHSIIGNRGILGIRRG